MSSTVDTRWMDVCTMTTKVNELNDLISKAIELARELQMANMRNEFVLRQDNPAIPEREKPFRTVEEAKAYQTMFEKVHDTLIEVNDSIEY